MLLNAHGSAVCGCSPTAWPVFGDSLPYAARTPALAYVSMSIVFRCLCRVCEGLLVVAVRRTARAAVGCSGWRFVQSMCVCLSRVPHVCLCERPVVGVAIASARATWYCFIAVTAAVCVSGGLGRVVAAGEKFVFAVHAGEGTCVKGPLPPSPLVRPCSPTPLHPSWSACGHVMPSRRTLLAVHSFRVGVVRVVRCDFAGQVVVTLHVMQAPCVSGVPSLPRLHAAVENRM